MIAHWLDGFCQGFAELARQYGVQLIGGDTTRGPLSISVQVVWFCGAGQGYEARCGTGW